MSPALYHSTHRCFDDASTHFVCSLRFRLSSSRLSMFVVESRRTGAIMELPKPFGFKRNVAVKTSLGLHLLFSRCTRVRLSPVTLKRWCKQHGLLFGVRSYFRIGLFANYGLGESRRKPWSGLALFAERGGRRGSSPRQSTNESTGHGQAGSCSGLQPRVDGFDSHMPLQSLVDSFQSFATIGYQ